MERTPFVKILGVWISEDLSWDKNCKEICKKAYKRIGMITKLKYLGVNREYIWHFIELEKAYVANFENI